MTAPKLNKAARDQVVARLVKRDGNRCMFPGCTKPFTDINKPTIDHWLPWSLYRDSSFKNLRLMHQFCNNKKGDIIPNNDGSLTLKRARTVKKARPRLCEECLSGRILLEGEVCLVCGSGPQPSRFPTAYKKKPKNCSHSGNDHCTWCFLGFIERVPVG